MNRGDGSKVGWRLSWFCSAGSSENLSARTFERFARGLREDEAAVRAGVTLPVSNGPVEGHINRLKTLKRQMYGRAGLGLLSRRLLLAG